MKEKYGFYKFKWVVGLDENQSLKIVPFVYDEDNMKVINVNGETFKAINLTNAVRKVLNRNNLESTFKSNYKFECVEKNSTISGYTIYNLADLYTSVKAFFNIRHSSDYYYAIKFCRKKCSLETADKIAKKASMSINKQLNEQKIMKNLETLDIKFSDVYASVKKIEIIKATELIELLKNNENAF